MKPTIACERFDWIILNACDGVPLDAEVLQTPTHCKTRVEIKEVLLELSARTGLLVTAVPLPELDDELTLQFLDGVFVDRVGRPLEPQPAVRR